MVEFTITVDIPQNVYDEMIAIMPAQEDRIAFVLNTFKSRVIQEKINAEKQRIETSAKEELQTKTQEIVEEYQ
jgi:hypothetical protein